MILTREAIIAEIDDGRLEIDPLEPNLIGPGSIDLRLADKLRVFRQKAGPLRLDADVDPALVTDVMDIGDSYCLEPGQTVLGLTIERLRLPEDICGWIQGRSRFARVGLLIHMTASFIQPGVNNRQVLEISNLAPFGLDVVAGVPICQVILERTQGRAAYKGRFRDQDKL